MTHGVSSGRLVAALAVIGACATPPSTNVTPTSAPTRDVGFISNRGVFAWEFVTEEAVSRDTLAITPTAAWNAIARTYSDAGLPAGVVREGTTTYGVPRATVRRSLGGVPLSRFIRCGTSMGIPNADNYDVTFSLISRLTPIPPGATVIESQLRAYATQTGVSGASVPCASTMDLERRIARLLEYHATRN